MNLKNLTGFKELEIVLHSTLGRLIDGYSFLSKFRQGASADAAHHDGVYLRPSQRSDGTTPAVAVVTVQILDGGELIRIGIDQDEGWR
jgi:hypothetical protein